VLSGAFGRPVFVGTTAHQTRNYVIARVEQKKARFCGNICVGGAILPVPNKHVPHVPEAINMITKLCKPVRWDLVVGVVSCASFRSFGTKAGPATPVPNYQVGDR
jgi:hypothetical protein